MAGWRGVARLPGASARIAQEAEFADVAGPAGIRRAFAQIFVGHGPGRVADIRRLLATNPADAVLTDGLSYGVREVHELGGPPWATFGDGPLPISDPDVPPFGPGLTPMPGPLGRLRNQAVRTIARHAIFGPAQRRYDQMRTGLGLRADQDVLDGLASPYLHLQACVPAFEYPTRHPLPDSTHWVGALRPDPRPWTPPSWWQDVTSASRPVVLVSQGSLRPDVSELLAPAIRALADADVLVVAVTGSATPDDVLAALGTPAPANLRLATFIPYDEALRHASAFVTNGGYTGVTLALHHGVPLVQAGTTEEKAEIGARIAYTGVGLALKTSRPSEGALEAAVRRVLTEQALRQRVAEVAADFRRHDASREGARLIEELAHVPVP